MGLIVVDSSVWIDWFADKQTIQTTALRRFTAEKHIVLVGDLILTEVLQGARSDRYFREAVARLSVFEQLAIVDRRVAIAAAQNYRMFRARGVAIRKTIDTLIATRCILDRIPLLYGDRDFDPFVKHLGLIPALDAVSGATQ
ncbi:PIN domain nuclease [Sphingomonas sp.]|uniref:type II toxin-antitoxin system VapC family toxin n=1 Tax=Sphingomonas sp. TaxID=28214 RepID=UPI003340B2DF